MLNVLIKDDGFVELHARINKTSELEKTIRLLNDISSSIIENEENNGLTKECTLYLRNVGENEAECSRVIKDGTQLSSLEVKDIINEVAIEPRQEKAKIVTSINYDHLIWLKNEIEKTGAKCSIE